MRRRLLGLLALVLMLYVPYAKGAGVTYYVDDGVSASDSYTCQQAQNPATPFRSIRLGVYCLQGGDILHIMAGTYTDAAVATAAGFQYTIPAGTAGAYTIIEGEGVGVTLSQPASTVPRCAAWSFESPSYLVLRKLSIDSTSQRTCNTEAGGIWFGHASLYPHHILFEDLDISGSGADGFLGSMVDSTLRRVRAHHNNNWTAFPAGMHGFYIAENSNNVLVEYSEFDHNGNTLPGSASDSGLQFNCSGSPCTGVVIRESSFHDNAEAGTFPNLTGAQIYRNTFCNNGTGDIEFWGTGISNNKVYHNTHCGSSATAVMFVGYVQGTISGNEVKNNILLATTNALYCYYGWSPGGGVDQCSNISTTATNITTGAITDYTVSATDYHLKIGSTAINAGTIISGFSTTSAGQPGTYFGALPDIGRYETGGEVTTGGWVESQGIVPQHARLSVAQIVAFMPGTRSAFTFPTPYNTRGYRLTIPSDCGSADCVDYVGHSSWRNTNAHEGEAEMLLFLGLRKSRGGVGPSLLRFNKATETITNAGSLFTAGQSAWQDKSGEGWYWSATQAKKIYMPDGPKLYRFDVDAKTFAEVFDVTAQFGSDRSITRMSSSADDLVHAGTLTVTSTGTALGCFVYEESGAEWHWYAKIATFAACGIDKSGRYVLLLEGTTAPTLSYNRFFDITTDTESRITGPSYTLGNWASGYGYFLGADDTNALANATLLYTMNPVVRGPVIHYNANVNLNSMNYPSHLNAKAIGTLAQQMFCGSNTSSNLTYPTDITCAKVEVANQQLIVAPVMTDPNASGGAWNNGSYGLQPKGNLDNTGTYFVWTSNLGGNRLDAFMVKVPRQLLMGGDDVLPSVPVNFEVQ